MKRVASRPWNLKVDKDYEPSITILIPAHNEEKLIKLKLENLRKVGYPKEKIQAILINDYSTDKTEEEAFSFLNNNSDLNLRILNMRDRVGKSRALNRALKHATGEIIVVSDADCFWLSNILVKALPYLSDPSVGAVTGIEMLLNPSQSWVTQTEIAYNNTVHKIRIGESKTQSTIFFQGGFGAYKRAFLSEFDSETDDSGTALNVVQKKARTLLIPEAIYYTACPSTWKGKIVTKVRRARQLVRIWVKCLKLLFKGELALSKKVCLPETFLYVFNPVIFMLFIVVTLLILLEQPILFVIFPMILFPIILIKKSRTLFVEFVQDNCILLNALFALISNEGFAAWKSVEESRSYLTRDVLEKESLI